MSLIRLLVVGVGSIGERHTRCFLSTGQVQVGICEPNDALRSKIADTYDITHTYSSLTDALAQKWDTILIATPAQLHISMARQAVAAGIKYILIEKPLAVTLQGIRELQAEAAAADATIGVAYVYRAHPAVVAMRDAVLSGRFGKPVQASVVSGQHFPFYRPAYASTYYARHATGGGAIQDALTHLINLTEWFIGPTTRLTAIASHQVLPNVDVEDTVNLMALHGSVPASYSHNQHQPVNDSTLQITCTGGACRFEVHKHRWLWATEPGSEWQVEQINFKDRDDWFTQQSIAWLDVIHNKKQPPCTLEEALTTLKANQAALKSAVTQGQWMEII